MIYIKIKGKNSALASKLKAEQKNYYKESGFNETTDRTINRFNNKPKLVSNNTNLVTKNKPNTIKYIKHIRYIEKKQVSNTSMSLLLRQRLLLAKFKELKDNDKWVMLDYLNKPFNSLSLSKYVYLKVSKQLNQLDKADLLEKDKKNLRKLILKKIGLYWDSFNNMLKTDLKRKYVIDYGSQVKDLTIQQIENLTHRQKENPMELKV